MGGGGFSSSAYDDAVKSRRATNTPDFKHTDDIRSGRAAAAAAPSLDPRQAIAGKSSALAGQNVRESRDIDGKESTPIIVIFDETGSMGDIPRKLQEKLPLLMGVIKDKAGIEHPQICFGAVGDTRSDRVPFQISQFEADNRCDEHLRQLYLEGNGGGQSTESYGLAHYFAAYRTATDAWDKRGQKGILVTIGDEGFDTVVRKMDIDSIFGVNHTEGDEKTVDVIAKAQERWDVFHLRIMETGEGQRASSTQQWREALGERCVLLDDWNLACEVIAGLVYSMQGAPIDKVADDLGLKGAARDTVTNALAPLSGNLPAHVASGAVPKGHGKGTGGVARV